MTAAEELEEMIQRRAEDADDLKPNLEQLVLPAPEIKESLQQSVYCSLDIGIGDGYADIAAFQKDDTTVQVDEENEIQSELIEAVDEHLDLGKIRRFVKLWQQNHAVVIDIVHLYLHDGKLKVGYQHSLWYRVEREKENLRFPALQDSRL